MSLYQRALAQYLLDGCTTEVSHEIAVVTQSTARYHLHNLDDMGAFVASMRKPNMYDRDLCTGLLYTAAVKANNVCHTFLMCLSGTHMDINMCIVTRLGRLHLDTAAEIGGNATTIRWAQQMVDVSLPPSRYEWGGGRRMVY